MTCLLSIVLKWCDFKDINAVNAIRKFFLNFLFIDGAKLAYILASTTNLSQWFWRENNTTGFSKVWSFLGGNYALVPAMCICFPWTIRKQLELDLEICREGITLVGLTSLSEILSLLISWQSALSKHHYIWVLYHQSIAIFSIKKFLS